MDLYDGYDVGPHTRLPPCQPNLVDAGGTEQLGHSDDLRGCQDLLLGRQFDTWGCQYFLLGRQFDTCGSEVESCRREGEGPSSGMQY